MGPIRHRWISVGLIYKTGGNIKFRPLARDFLIDFSFDLISIPLESPAILNVQLRLASSASSNDKPRG